MVRTQLTLPPRDDAPGVPPGDVRTAARVMPFACSGVAACFASSCIHPIDLAKVRLQLYATQNPGAAKPNFVSLIGGMVRDEGFASIYSGLSASLRCRRTAPRRPCRAFPVYCVIVVSCAML